MIAAEGACLVMDDGTPVPGWYTWAEFHARAVATAPLGATLVEVGVFCGRSLISLAKMAQEVDNNLNVVGVDWFRGSVEHAQTIHGMPSGIILHDCWQHLEANDVLDDVTLIATDSVKAARLFADGSVWSVFLDADHSEQGVTRDIQAWYPKVAVGGWFGGDDYDPVEFPGVVAAVDRLLPQRLVRGRWWYFQKGD